MRWRRQGQREGERGRRHTAPCWVGSYLPRRMFLNPQPVPPRTMAATRTAPAMEPMMMLVPLGPLYLSVSPVGGDVGRGLWILQSLPVQSGWQMHFPSLLQTPWWEQIRRSPLPGQVLKLKAEAGRQRWSRHNMLGPQAVQIGRAHV